MVLPILLIALLWTSCVVNVSVFNRSILASTVLPYNILVSKVKESTIQRGTEAITPPLVQRSVNNKAHKTVEVRQQNPIMTHQIFVHKSHIRNMADKDTTTDVEAGMS